jgi:hypothetical protein
MYDTHTPAEWLAFLSLGLSLTSATASPFLLLVDADHFAWPDLRPLLESRTADRLLVEVVTAKAVLRDAALSAAALLMLLTAPTKGALR